MTANHLPDTARYRHRQRKSDGFGYGFSVIVDETETRWEDRNGDVLLVWYCQGRISGLIRRMRWFLWCGPSLRGSGNIIRGLSSRLVYEALVE